MDRDRDVKAGKFISLILRHHPEAINITLDPHGFADTAELIQGVAARFAGFCMSDLERIVAENNKQRYAFNEDKTKIRARQGHSIKDIDLELPEAVPPDLLYHGTGVRSAEAIKKEGIKKMNRQHVHLSPDIETAASVGRRHGLPFVFTVDAAAMHRDGKKFYLSENGVWLTDYVDPRYLSEIRK